MWLILFGSILLLLERHCRKAVKVGLIIQILLIRAHWRFFNYVHSVLVIDFDDSLLLELHQALLNILRLTLDPHPENA